MARTGDRGGRLTRARIAEVATALFLERGFDEVTVAEVAAAAEVSHVTVFSHFARKEDLLLDRAPEAFDQLRAAIRHRDPTTGVLSAVRELAFELLAADNPLTRLDDRAAPLLRTVSHSAGLLARARELCSELENALAEELGEDPVADGDPPLVAALIIAAWRSAYLAAARRLLDDVHDDAVEEYRRRLTTAFDAVAHGITTRDRATT